METSGKLSVLDQPEAPDEAAGLLDVWASDRKRDTPYVAINLDQLRTNLARVAKIAASHSVALRPHVKTHKCIEIAKMQMALGAIGVTASKPSEAAVFIEAGIPSVTVAYPIVAPRVAQELADLARRHRCDLRFVVDSVEGLDALCSAPSNGARVAVFLEIDVGLQRCGIEPDSISDHPVTRRLRANSQLDVRGIFSHAGHAYGAASMEAIKAVAADELRKMRSAAGSLAAAGVPVAEISIGSTPTVLAAESFDGATELRPGNYVFLDATAQRLGIATRSDIALAVVTTVVSVNDQYCIVDAGSKVLSSDLGPHGTGGGNFGMCYPLGSKNWSKGRELSRLSEEHGFVAHLGNPMKVGTRAVVFPNHSCPVVNLSDRLVVFERGRNPVTWSVAARGKST